MATMLTEAQRDALLDRAVAATKAWLAVGPDTDSSEVDRRSEVAILAVTDAVTRGGHIHTLIAVGAGCSGLQIVDLIDDWSAQAQALRVERNAVANYERLVRDAARRHAVKRVGAEGYGAKSRIAREIGVTRPVVDEWIAKALAEEQ